MNTHPKKLLVIIGEAALEKFLVRDAKALGAHGHTIADVRGGGSHGVRDADWEANRSIRMEIICDPAVAVAISDHVLKTYCSNYSLTMFTADVGVLRPEKF
jgi:hypothetical protein